MRRGLDAVAVYRDPRVVAIFFMGFSSGLPLALTGATLGIWLKESNVSLTAIGLFALVGIAYNLKFLWAPAMDRAPLPWLTRRLGRRRSWALATQAALIASLLALGHSDPGADPALTALLALVVAFCSASQDIVIDAFRIELLEEREQGLGAASTQYGYRLGMIVSGAGALYAAAYGGWRFAFAVMAGCVPVGVATVLLTPEPRRAIEAGLAMGGRAAAFKDALGEAVVDPFAEFMRRGGWAMILVFIVLYKVGDALAGVMAGPFYIAMQFTLVEIANVSKVFGLGATLLGVFLGGLFVYRLGVMKALLVCGILQMLSNLMYAAQAMVGHDVYFLIATLGIENITGGMGSAAFVAYLSSLCNVAYTATQSALFSSLMAVPRTILASSGGAFAEALGWVPFFLFTTVAAIPGLLLLFWVMRLAPGDLRAPVPESLPAPD